MEIDPVRPDVPKQTTFPQAARDPLIRYSVFAALGCAGVCMVFTILYIFSYSLDSTLSFERHFDSYLTSGNTGNLSTVLGLHMAQNRMFLQSGGMVAGIFFAFLGLALFLVGIQGTVDATGNIRDYSTSVRRLAPGGIILLASMIFVGVSAMHPVDLILGPTAATTAAPTAAAVPSEAPAATQPSTQLPTQSPTQSTAQPATQPAVPFVQPSTTPSPTQTSPAPATTAHLNSQSTPTTPAVNTPQTTLQSTPQTAQPVLLPAPRSAAPRPVLVPINQRAEASSHVPPVHRFQP
jgi:hypothetical protein